ncbi:helix-hairpin-helix domain-containing protein [Desulfuromonas sp.]|uniref:ComEA family DNA-binding protein n=1 Tax=Desulfuromonas sp. TaxID=892 RepID=UPI0025BE1242|nr:helix-hairpin-helix domain-containing protein [Desulfuromonas sp.]
MKQLICMCVMLLLAALAGPAASFAAPQKSEVVESIATLNVNAAGAEELESLPGIGKVTAERIVAYRSEHGDFATPDDLVHVKGIGEKTLEKIRYLVSVK